MTSAAKPGKKKRRDDATLPLFAALAAAEDAEERGAAPQPKPLKNTDEATASAAEAAEARRIATLLRQAGVYLHRSDKGYVHVATYPPRPEDDPYRRPDDSPLLPATRAMLMTPGYATSRLVRPEDLVDEQADWWQTKSLRERAHRLAVRDAVDWHPSPGGSTGPSYEERYATALARHLIALRAAEASAASAGREANDTHEGASPPAVSWDHAPGEDRRRRYAPETEARIEATAARLRAATAPRVDASARAHASIARREEMRRYYDALPGPAPRAEEEVPTAPELPPDGTTLDPRAPGYDEAACVRRLTEALASLKAGRAEAPGRARWRDATGLWEAWLPTLKRMRGDDERTRGAPRQAQDRAVPGVPGRPTVRDGGHQARVSAPRPGQLDLLASDDGGRA